MGPPATTPHPASDGAGGQAAATDATPTAKTVEVLVDGSPKSTCEQVVITSQVEAASPLGAGPAVEPSTADNAAENTSNAASPQSNAASPKIEAIECSSELAPKSSSALDAQDPPQA